MYHLTKLITLLTTLAISHSQFFYNYEQDFSRDIPANDGYDATQYKYNSPSAVGQQFVQQVQRPAVPDTSRPIPRRRQQADPIQFTEEFESDFRRQRTQSTEPNVNVQDSNEFNNVQSNTAVEPVTVTRSTSRRVSRRRQRVNHKTEEEVVEEAPKYLAPSVFENVRLGQAPSGVYVPEDSLLNILRRDTPRIRPQNQINSQLSRIEPESEVTVTSQYQQPIPKTENQRSSSHFFVEPPSFQSFHINSEPSEYQQNYNRYQLFVQPPPNLQPAVRPVEQPRTLQVQQPQETPEQNPAIELPQNDEDFEDYEYGHRSRTTKERRIQISAVTAAPRRSNRKRQHRPTSSLATVPQPHVVYNAASSVSMSEERSNANQVETDDIYRTSRRSQDQPRRRQRVQVQAVTDAPSARRRATTFKPANLAIAALPDDLDDDGIPGTANVDYPTLHVIPKTSFSCSRQAHNGYYADLETSCQVVHLCQFGGGQDSFLCPNGTIFSQEKFSCQWWYEVDCQNSPRFYSINDSLYKVKKNE